MARTPEECLKPQIGQLFVQCAIYESEIERLHQHILELRKLIPADKVLAAPNEIVRKPDGKEDK